MSETILINGHEFDADEFMTLVRWSVCHRWRNLMHSLCGICSMTPDDIVSECVVHCLKFYKPQENNTISTGICHCCEWAMKNLLKSFRYQKRKSQYHVRGFGPGMTEIKCPKSGESVTWLENDNADALRRLIPKCMDDRMATLLLAFLDNPEATVRQIHATGLLGSLTYQRIHMIYLQGLRRIGLQLDFRLAREGIVQRKRSHVNTE